MMGTFDDITDYDDKLAYEGPGIYNDAGQRICSLHVESMQEFILKQGDYILIETTDEFENAMEYVGKTPPESIWSTPTDDWDDVRAPQIGTSPGKE
jgi:hypothetical protein